MTPEKLDYIFPFIVFFYGLIMVLVLENPYLIKIGEERLSQYYSGFLKHKPLAWMCFFVGGLWSAQNVWYSSL